MKGRAGDVIAVESEHVGQPERRGVIEEVLKEDPARYRIRWDDGHTSIFTPSAGSARIEKRENAERAKTT